MPRLALGLLIFCLAACVSDPQTSSRATGGQDSAELLQRQLELGVGYLRNQDYQRAREKLNRALEIDPYSARAHTTYGLLLQLEGEYELAEEHFQTALQHDGTLTQARMNYGAFLYSQQRYQAAVTQFSTASEDRFYGNRAAVFENLGMAYKALGDQARAGDAFARAIQLHPGQPGALLELAEIQFNEQNYVEARDLYNRHLNAATHSPRSLWLCIRLSRVLPELDPEADCQQTLKSLYPASEEYRLHHEARHGNARHDKLPPKDNQDDRDE